MRTVADARMARVVRERPWAARQGTVDETCGVDGGNVDVSSCVVAVPLVCLRESDLSDVTQTKELVSKQGSIPTSQGMDRANPRTGAKTSSHECESLRQSRRLTAWCQNAVATRRPAESTDTEKGCSNVTDVASRRKWALQVSI